MRNLYKKKQMALVVVSTLALCIGSSVALALDGTIRVKASYGLANYVAPSLSGSIATTYSTIGLGATYIFPSNVFMDFSTRMSGAGSSYNTNAISDGKINGDQPFSRTENTLTIGMPLENGLQGNAGVFTAETIFNLAPNGSTSQKMQGLTAGIGKGLPFNEGKTGSLGVNAAFALLQAKNTDVTGASTTSNISYGLSIGASYNYMFKPYLGVSADTKFQSYFIKYSTFSGDERIISASLSLVGQF